MNAIAPEELTRALRAFPAELRELVEAECAAGNQILDLHSCWPAPPAGYCIMLANAVSTRPRSGSQTVMFFERSGSSHSGEFSDPERMYFVVEAPKPPPPAPDMDSIRAELERREQAANANRLRGGGFW